MKKRFWLALFMVAAAFALATLLGPWLFQYDELNDEVIWR